MNFKVFKGQYWSTEEDVLIKELLLNRHNQPVISKVYNKLYNKLVYMSLSIRWQHYPTFFKNNLEEVVIDSLTYIFTNIWSIKDNSQDKYFSYINMMIRNFYRLQVRNDKFNNESVRDNTDVYNKPSSIINTSELSTTYKCVDIEEIIEEEFDMSVFRDNVRKELHRLYNKYIIIPEKSWESAEIILSKANHQKRKKYLASAISYILEDYNSYSLEEMNNYIYENTDLEYQQVITQSYNFFKKQGLFEENARNSSLRETYSNLPKYVLYKKEMYA